ncbi:hypothetical protein FGRA07_11396 [Fusarium graminearum]|uniref:Uncharacterized protein n=1 Tax=Gibberella zeae TaxID=5518 RepID=A0A2H3G266_GIBZA|nr:hypothetical protein FGRA07_11396 [Fusarium graminearum]
MTCSNPSIATRLRSAAADWNKHLESIKDPNDIIRQEQARIRGVSEKRIKDYFSNNLQDDDNESNNDSIAHLLESLLSDGQKMKELETEHEVTPAKKQELQDKVAKSVARGIIEDLIDILGLLTIQNLVSAELSPLEGPTSETKDFVRGTKLRAPDEIDASSATGGITTRSRTYSARDNRVRQRTTPSANPSMTEGDNALKRKRQVGDCGEQDIKQKRKKARVSTRQTPSIAGQNNSDSVSSSAPPSIRPGDLHQHSNETSVPCGRKGMKLQLKDIRLDVSRRSARVMLQRHPFRADLWVCLVFLPPSHASMSLDTMASQSLMPTFVQLVNRRRTANNPEGSAALVTVPPTVDVNTVLRRSRGEEGEAVKKSG